MDKIDIRDDILRTFAKKGLTENECTHLIDEDLIDIAESIVENLPIYVVMQQRELLIAFAKNSDPYEDLFYDVELAVDTFLEENSN